jgi:threonine dehydrogenase-like Zn-dependent dehydrogenase
VPERLEMARRNGIEAIDDDDHDDISDAIRELTDGRGPDSAIDAVGMEAHGVRQWTDDILPLLKEDAGDPLGVDDLTTHQLPLSEAPAAYSMFQKKEDGAIKVVLKP